MPDENNIPSPPACSIISPTPAQLLQRFLSMETRSITPEHLCIGLAVSRWIMPTASGDILSSEADLTDIFDIAQR